jgi:hypothetical protein
VNLAGAGSNPVGRPLFRKVGSPKEQIPDGATTTEWPLHGQLFFLWTLSIGELTAL